MSTEERRKFFIKFAILSFNEVPRHTEKQITTAFDKAIALAERGA